jgi:ABC-type Mn2+/Zn2+ transport system permease subunit
MNKSRIIYSILAILFGIIAISFGIFLIVYGEIDDSPGGQMIGLVVVVIGIVGIVKSKKKTFN